MDKTILIQQMQFLYQQQNWQAMLELCEQNMQYFPNSASIHYNRAIARAYLEQWQKAKEDLEKALEIRPEQENIKQLLLQVQQRLENAENKPLQELSPSQIYEQEGENFIKNFASSAKKKKQFGRYQIVEELGKGGMGKVYKAYDQQLDRYIALKVIISGEAAGQKEIDRFLREAKATAQLNHPCIITVYDIGIEEGSPYYTMDLVEGMSFKEYLQSAPRNISKVIKIMIKVGEAVHYAHQQGIVHRDLKPANIMIAKIEKPVVMDFGLAKIVADQQLSKTGDVIGTPAYMSPEQAQGKTIDKTTDVYALGVILYEILSGRPPFQGETYFNVVQQILQNDPIPPRTLNPEVPRELEAICLKCLEKKVEKRYNNAKVWSKDLDNFLNNRPIIAQPVTKYTLVKKWTARHKVFVFAIAIFFISLSSVTIWALAERRRARLNLELAQNEERAAKINLAKIALIKAKEASGWGKVGAYAGKALEFIKGIKGKKTNLLQKQGKAFIKLALQQYPLLWKTANGSNLVKSIAQSNQVFAFALKDKSIRLWNIDAGTEIAKCSGHTNDISYIAFDRSGKILASASWDKTIRLWNVNTGQEIAKFLGHTHYVILIAFSYNNQMLASVSLDKTVRLWDLSTGKEIKQLKHADYVTSLAFSPKDGALAFSSWDKTVRLWNISTGREIAKLSGHTQKVISIAFSPDGEILASASKDKTIKLWDFNTGKEIKQLLGHMGSVNFVTFGSDGKTLASASRDKTVRLWDHSSGREIAKFLEPTGGAKSLIFNHLLVSNLHYKVRLWDVDKNKEVTQLSGHAGPATFVAFAPMVAKNSGKILASASRDKTIRLWDVGTGKEIKSFLGHTDYISSIAFSSDGKTLASASWDKTVRLWNLDVGKEVKVFSGHRKKINSVAFSPDGKTLASASWDQTVRLWDLSAGKEIKVFSEDDGIVSLAFSPVLKNGEKTLAFAFYNTIRLWNSATGKIKTFFKRMGTIRAMAFSPDGKILASASDDRSIRLWSVKNGKEIAKFLGHSLLIRSISFSPDGKALVSTSDDQTVRIWNIATKKQIVFLEHTEGVNSAAFSANGKFLASASDDGVIRLWHVGREIANFANRKSIKAVAFKRSLNPQKQIILWASNNFVKLWDVAKNKEIAKISGVIGKVVFSLDGKYFACASENAVNLWSIDSGKKKFLFKHNKKINSIAFSEDGKMLASASDDNQAMLWHIAQNKIIAKFVHLLRVESVAFRTDNKMLATSCNKMIKLWDIFSGKEIATLSGHTAGVNLLAFSLDGKKLASVSRKTIKLWDVFSGKEIVTLLKHTHDITSIAFSPHGKTIAFSSQDKTIRLWDIGVCKEILKLKGHTRWATSVAFSFDGKRLASASKDTTVRLWDIASRTKKTKQSIPTKIFISADGKMLASSKNKVISLRNIASGKLIKLAKKLPSKMKWQKLAKKRQSSFFAYRVDVPGWLIEIALEKEPEQITRHLFEWQVGDDLSTKRYAPVSLWDYLVDPSIK